MLKSILLRLSADGHAKRFVTRVGIARAFARRFVAGETLDQAVPVVRALNAKGMATSLDVLGESVTNEETARATARGYLETLDRIHTLGLNSNVSLKLTAVGLDVSEDLCVEIMHEILRKAEEVGTFVRIDMEGSAYTARTLHLFEHRLLPAHPETVGVVLQAYLYRTAADVEYAIAHHVRVRLCKGAYQEPATVAYERKADVDANYVRCMHALLRNGHHPAIATHDEVMIAEAKRFIAAEGIARDRFEFQMLYGVRRDLQEQLVRDGYGLRVYIPFGTQWYPYLMRRLAERPANVAFVAGNIVKEALRRRQ